MYYFIVNPNAGWGKGGRVWRVLSCYMEKHQVEYEAYLTTEKGDARNIQGGMGVGISLSGLASAVANEGGVGVISCAGLGLLYPKGKGTYPEKCINGLKEEIRKIGRAHV